MFCKVTLSSQSDKTVSAIELMESVSAIATADANSTPTHSTASIDVISNESAGGWTLGTATETDTAVVTFPHLTLIRDSGKSSKPYTFISFIKQFNVSYLDVAYGFLDSDTYPDFDGYTSSDQYWFPQSLGYNSSLTGTNNADNIAESLFSMVSGTEYYILCTEECIHIQHAGTSRLYSGAWFHWGLRTNQSWEDYFNDNPYWVALWDHGYQFENTRPNGYWTKMRTLNPDDGTFGSPVVVSRFTEYGHVSIVNNSSIYGWHHLTGYEFQYVNPYTGRNNNNNSYPIQKASYEGLPQGSSNPANYGPDDFYHRVPNAQWDSATGFVIKQMDDSPAYPDPNYALCVPIHTIFQDGIYHQNGLTIDTNNNSIIPAASTMPIKLIKGLNQGGVMKNILQGAKFKNNAAWENYGTQGATVNIDGTNYIMVGFTTNDDYDPPRFCGNIYVKKT